MISTINGIQKGLARHFGVSEPTQLAGLNTDGEYLILLEEGDTEPLEVRVVNDRIWVKPDDFDREKAIRIAGPEGLAKNDPQWLGMAARFELGAGRFKNWIGQAVIERCTQRDGSYLWAIRDQGLVLNAEGQWEYEPIPSSRDDHFLARCRYATKEEAWEQWNKFGPCDYPVAVP